MESYTNPHCQVFPAPHSRLMGVAYLACRWKWTRNGKSCHLVKHAIRYHQFPSVNIVWDRTLTVSTTIFIYACSFIVFSCTFNHRRSFIFCLYISLRSLSFTLVTSFISYCAYHLLVKQNQVSGQSLS